MSNQFGKLLREERKKARFTLSGLAGLLDVAPGKISAIERGLEGPLSAHQIRKVARLIDADPRLLQSAADQDLREAFHQQWPLTVALQSSRHSSRRR